MKSLGATVVLLLCVLTLALINFHYVNAAIRELEELLDALPPIEDAECYACTEQINAYWEEKEKILEMSISYPFIDRVSEQVSLLSSCASIKDVYGFYSAKALLYDALEDLSRSECLSFGILL